MLVWEILFKASILIEPSLKEYHLKLVGTKSQDNKSDRTGASEMLSTK